MTIEQGGSSADILEATLEDLSSKLNYLVDFEIPAFDYISVVRNATSNVWTYKDGGSGGTTVATITVNYSDATKTLITNIAKT